MKPPSLLLLFAFSWMGLWHAPAENTSEITVLRQEIREMKELLTLQEKRITQLERIVKKQKLNLTGLPKEEAREILKTEKAIAEKDLARARTKYTSAHPMIRTQEERLNNIQKQLSEME